MTLFIGLTGEAGSGKDTVSNILTKIIPANVFQVSFAAPVYALAEALVGKKLSDRKTKETRQVFHISQSNLETMCDVYNQHGLNTYMSFPDAWNEFFNGALAEYASFSPYEEFALVLSPRKLLELVGTELGREILSEKVWLNTLTHSVKKAKADVVIVSDVRFDNEAIFIKDKLKGIIVKVVCPSNVHKIDSTHASAKGITSTLLDYDIINYKTGIAELETQLGKFYTRIIKGRH